MRVWAHPLVLFDYPNLGAVDARPGEGVALEAQQLPDAINHENFGDVVLKRNEKKTYHISFAFEKINRN